MISGHDLHPARQALERDGHVTVRELVDHDEVARFRSLVHRALANAERLELPPGNDVYQRAFLRARPARREPPEPPGQHARVRSPGLLPPFAGQ